MRAAVVKRDGSLMASGALDARLWFDPARPYALDDINQAIAAVAHRESLKAVVRIAG